MRIDKVITQEKMPWSIIQIKEMYGDPFGEFVCWYWGLKG